MAQSTINVPSDPNRPPPLAISDEFGDSWKEALDKVNLNFTELYEAVPAGTGGTTFAPSGAVSVSVTQIGSSATNTTQTLKTYTLAANALAEDGAGLEVIAWGSKGANAAPVTLALNVGAATINTGSYTQNGTSWVMKSKVYRRGSAVQRIISEASIGSVLVACKSTGDTASDTATIAITVQALDASAAQSNVLADGLVVNFFKAP